MTCRNPWPTSPKAYEETFQKAIQCNCRKCRGEKGSQADIVEEELQEKDTTAAKSTKIKHSEASKIDDLDKNDNWSVCAKTVFTFYGVFLKRPYI